MAREKFKALLVALTVGLVISGCGYGAATQQQEAFQEAHRIAA